MKTSCIYVTDYKLDYDIYCKVMIASSPNFKMFVSKKDLQIMWQFETIKVDIT